MLKQYTERLFAIADGKINFPYLMEMLNKKGVGVVVFLPGSEGQKALGKNFTDAGFEVHYAPIVSSWQEYPHDGMESTVNFIVFNAIMSKSSKIAIVRPRYDFVADLLVEDIFLDMGLAQDIVQEIVHGKQ